MVKSVGLTQRTLQKSEDRELMWQAWQGHSLDKCSGAKQPKAGRPQGGSDWNKMSYFYTRAMLLRTGAHCPAEWPENEIIQL